MKYVAVTHVDAVTGISGYKETMYNGPTFPKIAGLQLEWWDESRWPLTHPDQYPRFFGTCDDDADLNIDGFLFEMTLEEYNQMKEDELRARLPQSASPMRIRLALLEMGLLETVQSYFESLQEPIKSKVKIMWEFSTEINKNHPAVLGMKDAMEITQETLDEIFIKANEISDNPFSTEE